MILFTVRLTEVENGMEYQVEHTEADPTEYEKMHAVIIDHVLHGLVTSEISAEEMFLEITNLVNPGNETVEGEEK